MKLPFPVGVIRASCVCIIVVLEFPYSLKQISSTVSLQSLQTYTVPVHTVATFKNINQVSTSIWRSSSAVNLSSGCMQSGIAILAVIRESLFLFIDDRGE